MLSYILSFVKTYRVSLLLLVFGAVYAGFMILIHDPTAGDYQMFVKIPMDVGYGMDRWFNWSSRLLIESSVNIFSKHLILWKIVTIILGALLLWSLGRVLRIKRIYQAVLLFCMILLINTHLLATAGIFAASINYLWPAASFAFVVAIILVPFQNRTVNRISRVVVWPFYFYAMCSEQLAILGVLFTCSYIVFILYKRQRVPSTLWILLCVSIIGVFNILISPGNESRKILEIATWWPGFDTLSLLYKIAIGSIVTLTRLFIAPEIPAILLIMSVVAIAYKFKNLQAFIAVMPAVVIILLFIFPSTYGSQATASWSPNYFNEVGQRALLFEPNNLPDSQMVRELLLIFAVIISSLIVSLVLLCRRSPRMFIIPGVILAGFLVSTAVSFSPTLFASTTRTLYPFLIILACINYYLLNMLISTHFYPVPEAKTRLRSK